MKSFEKDKIQSKVNISEMLNTLHASDITKLRGGDPLRKISFTDNDIISSP